LSDTELKERILYTAVFLFCRNGFHGTSMRDIAKDAQCSLPMMYYHYKNKNDLYEEIAVKLFFQMIERNYSTLDLSLPPLEFYLQVARMWRSLSELDRCIYKISLRLYFGFEGSAELREKIVAWEKARVGNNRRLLDSIVKDAGERQVFAEIFTGFLEYTMDKMVLLDEDVPEEVLRVQLEFLLSKV
jgi:AcrR family transcriptional regulator